MTKGQRNMTNYKLLQLEPTPEMVEAAGDAYMPFGDMDLAIRMAMLAAPDVQGEPAPADKTERITEQDAREIATNYCHWKSVEFYNAWFSEKGRELINKLNADREQQPDVAQLVEALERAHMALIGYLPGHRNDITDAAIAQCEATLAPYWKGAENAEDLPGTWHESDLSGGWADSCSQDSKEPSHDNQ